MSSSHDCPAPGCDIQVSRSILACRSHWFALPQGLRNRINSTWRDGDTGAYLQAREDAVAWWEAHA